jgi:GGDEF domain-containing protein
LVEQTPLYQAIEQYLGGQAGDVSMPRWFWHPLSNQVWSGYADPKARFIEMPLIDWLNSLDPSCRVAASDKLFRAAHLKSSQICNLCHDNGTWVKFELALLELGEFELVCAQVSPLQREAAIPEPSLQDAESGLMSAELFRELLLHALRLSQRNHEPFVLLSVLFDNHLDGSVQPLVPLLADVMRQRLRRSDSVGRLNHEELLVLLYGAGPQVAQSIAYKLQQAIENSLCHYPHQPVKIGWAYYPWQGEDVDTLLAHRFEHHLS